MVKIFIKNNRGFIIAANHWFAGSESIIIMSAGFTGDKSMEGRFDKIAEKFCESGYGVIAYDYCGCGESDDEILMPGNAVQDLYSVIAYAKNRGYSNIGLYGQSYGSLISLRAYSKDIGSIVLAGAITGTVKYDWNKYYSEKQVEELNRTGYMIIKKNSKTRDVVIINRELLDDFDQIDQESLLSKVKCPVLIIHGDKGEEEIMLLKITQRGIRFLPRESRIEIIEGADHKFNESSNEIAKLAIKWFRNSFS
ncbi:MAG: alpha/beta hydrolase [Ignavibacteriaceae bacterium]|nr:alpha/beta hydrolase [Ignavibacteriaceae bacterium]